MSVDAAANQGTTPVRKGFELDEARLFGWLREHVEGFKGPASIQQFKGGQSNPTFKIVTPSRSYVLRRKPGGPIIKGAHAIEREARVISALAHTGFPVPAVQALCLDDSVIGSWFYVMDLVEGRIFWDATFPEMSASDRASCFSAMNATLARLHSIAPDVVGLGDFGSKGNYFERQIRRWSTQYLDDADAGRDPGMDRLIEWLPNAIPPGDETAIVHGDFRCDNLVFHPDEPRILAVLDWELSTLGHPLADFAYHAMMFRMPPDIVAGLGGTGPLPKGIPTEADYRAEYARNSGRAPISDSDYAFYIAFNFFRLAAIFHGIKGRVIRGTASSAHAQERARSVPRLIDLAVASMNACL